jgi:Chromo (CHRromatin Organisation MOdifier) domain
MLGLAVTPRRNKKAKRQARLYETRTFKIEAEEGHDNYKLRLPKSMNIHPVFHISLLEPTRNPATEEETEIAEHGQEYEVEMIKDYTHIDGQFYYLVKWKGYDESENTWEPIKHLTQCSQKIRGFHEKTDLRPQATREKDQTLNRLSPRNRRPKRQDSGKDRESLH